MDEDKPFTVRDRRKFTAEGDLNNDTEEGSALVEPAPTPETPAPETTTEASTAAAGRMEERVDLAGFLVSLATQASVLLSTSEGDVRENLRGAQHLIGVLEMLEDKTRGRRTPDEDQVLQQILYELRMAFVARNRTVST